MDIINSWQFYIVLYLIFIVIFYQSYKIAVLNVKNDGAATILLQILAGISVLIWVPFFDLKISSIIWIYILLSVACIFYALNDRLQTTARKHLPVSTFSIIFQFSTVILIIYGLVFFKDNFSLGKIIGGLLIILGNICLLYSKGKLEFNRNVIIAFIATIAFATAISIDIGISKHFNLPFYIMLTLIIPSIMVTIVERLSIGEIKSEIKKSSYKYFIITGVAWGIAILVSLKAYQLGPVSIVAPLQTLSVPINVCIAFFIFNERSNIARKTIAGILVLIGVSITFLNL